MAYSTISKPGLHFNTKLYTGNASTNAITGVGFQPDWVWIKNRVATSSHNVFDAVRGATKTIFTNTADPEATEASRLSSFDSDGFTINGDTSNQTNANGSAFVSWNWKAGGGQGTSNTDGSINTTYTSVNTTAGFSISSYTGTGSNATVGHGLGAVPKVIIIKELNPASTRFWRVYHEGMGNSKVMYLDQTSSQATDTTAWNSTSPTTSVFSLGSSVGVNESGKNFIAYCFAEKQGYSKFGKYEGNGDADGTFVYCGFKPAFTIIKRQTASDNWAIHDSERPDRDGNPHDAVLRSNLSDAEYGGSSGLDFLSNGFKARQNDGEFNNGSSTYVYLAFAEEPLVANVGSGVPATAV
jgi:hypothetical protein